MLSSFTLLSTTRCTSLQSASIRLHLRLRALRASRQPHTPSLFSTTSNKLAKPTRKPAGKPSAAHSPPAARTPSAARTSKPPSSHSPQTPTKPPSAAPPRPPPPITNKPFTGTQGTPPATPSATTLIYPARILVYKLGYGKIYWVALFRIAGLLFFIYTAAFVLPSYWVSNTSDSSPWGTAAIILGVGGIPLILMTLSSAPMVTFAHLSLPAWARASAPRLARYAENLPPSAELDVTTLRWIVPRETRVKVSELQVQRGRVGTMYLKRNVPRAVVDAKRWWHWPLLKTMYVAGKSRSSLGNDIWEKIVASVARGYGQSGQRATGGTVDTFLLGMSPNK